MVNSLPPGIPASFWDDYRARYEAEIAEVQKQLAPLESGHMHLYEAGTNGVRRDVTTDWIDRLRKTIKNYEAILDALKRGELR
jgi:hypothetical protein